jgi:predicted dehydrogenase
VSAEPVRVAVIGLGYWGPNLLRNLVETEAAEVVRICDARPEKLAPFVRRFPAIPSSTRYDDVIEDEQVEAVVIATPVATHFELASIALRAGKHVFVEKPLSARSDEARHLIDLADEGDLVLMPGHTFLYSPPVVFVRGLIESEQLGELYFISTSRVNLGLHQPDVSVAWDLGPHDFSILRYWLDESPTYVSALSRSCVFPDTPDVAFINLGFPSGTIAHIELAWLAPSKLRRTAIVGSESMVVYDDTAAEPVRVFNSGATLRDPESFGEFQLSYRTGDIVSPRIDGVEPLLRQMEDFCRAIREHTVPRSSAALGLEVVEIIEAVDRSLTLDGSPVVPGDREPVRSHRVAPL